jgi:KUP system potassium uptake protein
MANSIQAARVLRQDTRKQIAAAALTALGVVYGDIGTSPLYALKQAVGAGGEPTPGTVMGIVSVILSGFRPRRSWRSVSKWRYSAHAPVY